MTPRTTKGAPFLWMEKKALDKIRASAEDGVSLPDVLATYLALCFLASNAQTESFIAGKQTICGVSGVSMTQTKRALLRLRALGLIDWTQNFVPGSKEQLPSTYVLGRASVDPPSGHRGPTPRARAHNEAPGLVQKESDKESDKESQETDKKARFQPAPVPQELKNIGGFGHAWEVYLLERHLKKKPATTAAQTLWLEKLAQRPSQAVAALETATAAGWNSLEWEWIDDRKTRRQPRSAATQPKIDYSKGWDDTPRNKGPNI